MRYILALVPTNESVAAQYIETAQALFKPHHDSYLLSTKVSPHITVCQFETEEEKQAERFWTEVGKLSMYRIVPRFTGVSFQRGAGNLKQYYWAEISVARDENLMRMHLFALDSLKNVGLTSFNDSGDLYRPHLTLARMHLPPTIIKWKEEILDDPGEFKLTLAKGDNHGQYLSTLLES